LKKLSGKAHEVFTAVCIQAQDTQSVVVDSTKVYFRALTDQDIEQYINECQPFDKAGGYGVQDWIGLVAIHKIEGSYFNVMGFPSHLVYDELEKVVSQLNLKNHYA
ncbi:MAG: Maf family protein, partial [Flavobacteriaceae bacterium]|nr:Maf family protein [Flavobacteriaceae bacterium]